MAGRHASGGAIAVLYPNIRSPSSVKCFIRVNGFTPKKPLRIKGASRPNHGNVSLCAVFGSLVTLTSAMGLSSFLPIRRAFLGPNRGIQKSRRINHLEADGA